NPPPGSFLPTTASSDGSLCGGKMRACWAATLLLRAQRFPASCATCRGIFGSPLALSLIHRHYRWSSYALQPSSGISGSIASSSSSFPLPETVPILACQFKGSVQFSSSPPGLLTDQAIVNRVLVRREFDHLLELPDGFFEVGLFEIGFAKVAMRLGQVRQQAGGLLQVWKSLIPEASEQVDVADLPVRQGAFWIDFELFPKFLLGLNKTRSSPINVSQCVMKSWCPRALGDG